MKFDGNSKENRDVQGPTLEPKNTSRMIAKRDFLIEQNSFRLTIKAGDDITDIPARFIQNLKTEKVI